MNGSLTVTEIYASIQGESSYAGFPCTFVRLTGCPLRCRWCDTAYAFKGGQSMTMAEVMAEVERLAVPLVELTGGEPLAQDGGRVLCEELVAKGYKVLIETSGSESVAGLDPAVHIIMDLKCPDSGMTDRMLWSNLDYLKPSDEIKFVVASRADFDWALMMTREHRLDERFKVLFSSAWGHVHPKDLAAWMIDHPGLGARLQLQQHKYIWGPRAKGV